VAFTDYESDEVEDGGIGGNLLGKPLERVSVALQLEAMQGTVDNGQINAA
jgi:hypothetical protein